MPEPRIFIVIPVFNRRELTRACLRSLAQQSYRNFQTMVVDDGSTDGTSAMIKQDFPEVLLLHGDGNLWWTGAVNVGVRQALSLAQAGDFVLLLNDDLVMEADYLHVLQQAAQRMPHAVIGSVEVLADDPDVIFSGAVRVNWLTAKQQVLHAGQRLSKFARDHLEPVSIQHGRGALYPVAVFKEVGLFDDRHFKQCGDTELPRRAALRGFPLYVCYGAVVKTTAAPSGKNINTQARYTLRDFRKYFFDVRSNCRLVYRWYFCRNTFTNPLARLNYFCFDVLRITWRFFSRLSFRQP